MTSSRMIPSLLRTFAVLACLAPALAHPALAQAPSPSTATPTAPVAPAAPASPSVTKPSAEKPTAPVVAPAAKAELIDLNSAAAPELETLPGIGAARSAAIIKGRPYRGKDQLVSKKILTQGVYDGIKDKVIAKQK